MKKIITIRFAFDPDEDIDLPEPYIPGEGVKISAKKNAVTVHAKKFRAYIKDKTNGTVQ